MGKKITLVDTLKGLNVGEGIVIPIKKHSYATLNTTCQYVRLRTKKRFKIQAINAYNTKVIRIK